VKRETLLGVYRHPELVSGSNWSHVEAVEDWMLKQVQHDEYAYSIALSL
jgi:hypothetical protein